MLLDRIAIVCQDKVNNLEPRVELDQRSALAVPML